MSKRRRHVVNAGLSFAVGILAAVVARETALGESPFSGTVPFVLASAAFWTFSSLQGRSTDRRGDGPDRFSDRAPCSETMAYAGIGTWIWDRGSGELHCDENVFKLLGRKEIESSLAESAFFESIHPEDRESFHLALEGILSGRRRSPLDCRFLNPASGIVWVELRMSRIDGGRTPERIAGSMMDVSDRKQIEFLLDREAACLEAILENTDNMVFSIDRDYRLTTVNSRFIQKVRALWRVDLQVGDSVLAESPDEISSSWKGYFDRALAGESFRMEEAFNGKGRCFYFDVSLNPIRERGYVTGVSVYGCNITRRKQREMELLRAIDKAEESDRLKSAFLANMSHEIRTPLNAIMGFTQLLKADGISTADKSRFLDVIYSNGSHLLRIIGDIIDLAQIESDQMRVESVCFDVSLMMAETYSIFSDRVRLETNAQVEFVFETVGEEPDYAKSDETRIKQVLYNLISNAVKFTEAGYIRAGYGRLPNGMIEFFVSDSGEGVPLEMRELIFERFQQAGDRRGRGNDGVGLGLSICRGLVRHLGGEIWVEANSPLGSTFKFTVLDHGDSKSTRPVEMEERKSGRSVASGDALTCGRGGIVLIAEDDESNYQLVKSFLGFTKLRCIRAEDGLEAVRWVERESEICLVFMDLSMPILDGLEATKRIKELRPDLTVIGNTAHAMKSDINRAVAAGCSDCLVKPVSIDSFREVLRRYL